MFLTYPPFGPSRPRRRRGTSFLTALNSVAGLAQGLPVGLVVWVMPATDGLNVVNR